MGLSESTLSPIPQSFELRAVIVVVLQYKASLAVVKETARVLGEGGAEQDVGRTSRAKMEHKSNEGASKNNGSTTRSTNSTEPLD